MRVDPKIAAGIITTAQALGVSPIDLATAISYETAGTFDPTKAGPRTKWGQHRGLIQFGEPQAQQYGVDWQHPIQSQLGPSGAVAKYLRKAGVKPGMSLLDIYSAINAGGVGRYGASDEAAGGAPGTVRDKVEKQMADHRRNAMLLLGRAGVPSKASQMAPATPPAPAPRQHIEAGTGRVAQPVNTLAPQMQRTVTPPPAGPVVAAMGADPFYARNALRQIYAGPTQNVLAGV